MSEIDDMAAFMEERLNEEAAGAEGPPGWNLERWTAVKYADEESGRNWRVDAEPRCVVDAVAEEDALFIACHDPARVLAGVEAKRAVLSEWAAFSGILEGQAMRGQPADTVMAFQVRVIEGIMRKLCTEWAAHPGYRPAWKP